MLGTRSRRWITFAPWSSTHLFRVWKFWFCHRLTFATLSSTLSHLGKKLLRGAAGKKKYRCQRSKKYTALSPTHKCWINFVSHHFLTTLLSTTRSEAGQSSSSICSHVWTASVRIRRHPCSAWHRAELEPMAGPTHRGHVSEGAS